MKTEALIAILCCKHSRTEEIIQQAIGRAQGSEILFSEINQMLLGYFDPTNVCSDSENTFFSA